MVCDGKGTIVALDYGTGKRAPIPEAYAAALIKDRDGIPWKKE